MIFILLILSFAVPESHFPPQTQQTKERKERLMKKWKTKRKTRP